MKIEWRDVGTTSGTSVFYNTRKMICDDKGILRVWIKSIEKDTSKPLAYSIDRIELNCRSSQMRTISRTKYGRDGRVLDSFAVPTPTWQDLTPDSLGESVWETVCHKTL